MCAHPYCDQGRAASCPRTLFASATMARMPSPPAPIVARNDVVVISGGHLKAKAEVALPVRAVGSGKFWVISTHCPKASELLTGVAACHRPLCKLSVFDTLRKGIMEARSAKVASANEEQQARKDDEEEAAFNFAGEEVDDEALETPTKAKRPRLSKKKVGLGTAAEKPTVQVQMPKFYGQAAPVTKITMVNSTREIGISADTDTLTWLIQYIHSERSA